MAGALLALTIGVRSATTGLRIVTLPRTLTASTSTLRTSALRIGTARATALQSVVFLKMQRFSPMEESSYSGISGAGERGVSSFERRPQVTTEDKEADTRDGGLAELRSRKMETTASEPPIKERIRKQISTSKHSEENMEEVAMSATTQKNHHQSRLQYSLRTVCTSP